jgi:hypothetical protein
VPKDLSTACFDVIDLGNCTGRIDHDRDLSKDKGSISYTLLPRKLPNEIETSDPQTPRGKLGTNFDNAVKAAVLQTTTAWTQFGEGLIHQYGSQRGIQMICALTHDDPVRDCTAGNGSALADIRLTVAGAVAAEEQALKLADAVTGSAYGARKVQSLITAGRQQLDHALSQDATAAANGQLPTVDRQALDKALHDAESAEDAAYSGIDPHDPNKSNAVRVRTGLTQALADKQKALALLDRLIAAPPPVQPPPSRIPEDLDFSGSGEPAGNNFNLCIYLQGPPGQTGTVTTDSARADVSIPTQEKPFTLNSAGLAELVFAEPDTGTEIKFTISRSEPGNKTSTSGSQATWIHRAPPWGLPDCKPPG